jgi:Integrase zinc binding domain
LEDVKKNLREDYSLHNGYLFRGIALCIPATSLRYLIIKEMHNQGHFGIEKTLHLVRERFFWPRMWRDVKHFVRACHVCQTSKGTNTNQGLYNSLPIPFEIWHDISMDFVTGLPQTRKKNDSIMVVVDRFSKMTIFIACKTTVDAPKVAELYFNEVVRHHGLPSTIVSDRDTKFLSKFWMELWKKLKTDLKFSSTFHPQTDSQTEVVNRSHGNMLRAQVTTFGMWDTLLPKIEFEYNCSVNRSTGFAPFKIVYGYIPRGPLDTLSIERPRSKVTKVEERLEDLRELYKTVREKLEQSYSKYKAKADEKHRDVQFEVGELVWVYLPKERFPRGEYHKLKKRKVGPCEIAEKFGANAYRVKLPEDLHISNTFNVSHLHKYYEEDARLRSSFNQPGEPDAVRTEVMTDSDSDTDDGHTKFKPIKELYVQLEI